MRRHEKDFNLRGDKKYLAKMVRVHGDFSAALPREVADRALRSQLRQRAGNYLAAFKDLVANVAETSLQHPIMRTSALEVEKPALGLKNRVPQLIARESRAAKASESIASRMILWALGLTVLVGALLSILSVRSITKPITNFAESLRSGAGQLASSSGQVASAGQSLAKASSEQAAALEQTSSSLEEVSSMTHQNADHVATANDLMKEAKSTMERAAGTWKT